jgi:hypothetical protein
MCQCQTGNFILTTMEFDGILKYFVGKYSGTAISILAQDQNVI